MFRLTPISSKKFEKFLRFIGCEYIRCTGDHLVYRKKGLKRPVIIPKGELPVFIIKNNLRTLGISNEKYLEIIEKKI